MRAQRIYGDCLIVVCLLSLNSVRQSAQAEDADALAKQLANPVAALISVPLQLNWDTGIGADGLGNKWLLNIQPVVPIVLNDKWNVISRTILPVEAQSDVVSGDVHQSGLGDITESFFFTPRQPLGGGWIVAAGPAILLPTATDPSLGNGKWGSGATVLVLKQTPSAWTAGALWSHIWSIAGSDNRPSLNATSLQPFISKGLGKGITVSANLETSYDWEGRHWVVPMNLSFSKVTKLGISALVSGRACATTGRRRPADRTGAFGVRSRCCFPGKSLNRLTAISPWADLPFEPRSRSVGRDLRIHETSGIPLFTWEAFHEG
jgi:hypothetical protein